MLLLHLSVLSAKSKETLTIDAPQEYNFLQLKEYIEEKYSIPTYVQKYICKGKMLTPLFTNEATLQEIFGNENKKAILVTVSGEVQKQEMKQLRIDDILGYVISFLTLEEVFICLRVCKNWYQIAREGSYKNQDRFILLPNEKHVFDLLDRKIVQEIPFPLVSFGNFVEENFSWRHSLPQESARHLCEDQDPQIQFMINDDKLICFQLLVGTILWQRNLEEYQHEYSVQQKLKRILQEEDNLRRQRRVNAAVQGLAFTEEQIQSIPNPLLVVHYDNKTKSILAQFQWMLMQLRLSDGAIIKCFDLDELYSAQNIFKVPLLGYISMSTNHWILVTPYHVLLLHKSTLNLVAKIPLESADSEQYMVKMVTTGIKRENYLVIVGTDQTVRVVDIKNKRLILEETLHGQEGSCFTNDFLFCNGDRLFDFEEQEVTIRATHIQNETRFATTQRRAFCFYETIIEEEEIPKLEGFFTVTADNKIELNSLLREEKIVYKNRERVLDDYYLYNTVYGWNLQGLRLGNKWHFTTFGERMFLAISHDGTIQEEEEVNEDDEQSVRKCISLFCLNCKTGLFEWKQIQQLSYEPTRLRIFVKNFHLFVVDGTKSFLYTLTGKQIWSDILASHPEMMHPTLYFINMLQ